MSTTSIREQLIFAGIKDIGINGLSNFSVRRVAAACGVSCAAPYKHFENRESFIAAIIEYINDSWFKIQAKVIEDFEGDLRKQILELSMAYVHFLVDNPHFRSIIMLSGDGFDGKYKDVRSKLSNLSKGLAEEYCKGVGFSSDDTQRKMYVVRSLLYGAALMFDNGQLPYTKKSMEFVRMSIDREFDLP